MRPCVDLAPPPPDSVLLPQLEPLDTVTAGPVGVEQPHAFRSALPERAPPVSALSLGQGGLKTALYVQAPSLWPRVFRPASAM